MFEALPRLAVLRASGVQYDGVLVPQPLSQFHQDTLDLVGVPAEERVPFAGSHVAPDELVWAAPLAPIGFPTPYLVQWLSSALGGGRVTAPDRRIYLARRHSRRVVNERAVLRILGPLELELVYPEELSFREQVDLFSATKLMIGPHGAGFSNAIFSPSVTALEIYQPAHINLSITGVFAAAGHEHWSLIGRRVPGLARRRHQNVWVPTRDLARSLERLSAAVAGTRQ
jgi:capsular polysaccharide biosynthesis protein